MTSYSYSHLVQDVSSGYACVDCAHAIANGGTGHVVECECGCGAPLVDSWEAAFERGHDGVESIVLGHRHTFGECGHPRECPDDCTCEREEISSRPCDVCGSQVDGYRHAVTFWLPIDDDARRRIDALSAAGCEFEEVLEGYLDAFMFSGLLYSDNGEDEPVVLSSTDYGIEDLPLSVVASATEDLVSLVSSHPLAVRMYAATYGWSQFGAEFLYTRDGHGTGFWDTTANVELGDYLTKASKPYGDSGASNLFEIEISGELALAA